MKLTTISLGICLGLASVAMVATSGAEAKPGGCLKYGAAGAVAGHYAGHHAVKGALAGCAVGMWRRHEYKKKMREERKMQETAPTGDKPPASSH